MTTQCNLEPFAVLQDLGLLDWPTLLVGWRNHWITRFDLIDYANARVTLGDDAQQTALIARGGSLSDAQLGSLLEVLVRNQGGIRDEPALLERWELAWVSFYAEPDLDWGAVATEIAGWTHQDTAFANSHTGIDLVAHEMAHFSHAHQDDTPFPRAALIEHRATLVQRLACG